MIITLASSKGGVGKSTVTGCLAGVWAAAGQSVQIVDLDANRTVSRWFNDDKTRPNGISVSTPDPTGIVRRCSGGGGGETSPVFGIGAACAGVLDRGPNGWPAPGA